MIRLNPTRIGLTNSDLSYHLDRIFSRSPKLATRRRQGKPPEESYDGDGVFLDSDIFSYSDSSSIESDCDSAAEGPSGINPSGSHQECLEFVSQRSLSSHTCKPSKLRRPSPIPHIHCPISNCSSSKPYPLDIGNIETKNIQPAVSSPRGNAFQQAQHDMPDQSVVKRNLEQDDHSLSLGLQLAPPPNTSCTRVNELLSQLVMHPHSSPNQPKKTSQQRLLVFTRPFSTHVLPAIALFSLPGSSRNEVKHSEILNCSVISPGKGNCLTSLDVTIQIYAKVPSKSLRYLEDLSQESEDQSMDKAESLQVDPSQSANQPGSNTRAPKATAQVASTEILPGQSTAGERGILLGSRSRSSRGRSCRTATRGRARATSGSTRQMIPESTVSRATQTDIDMATLVRYYRSVVRCYHEGCPDCAREYTRPTRYNATEPVVVDPQQVTLPTCLIREREVPAYVYESLELRSRSAPVGSLVHPVLEDAIAFQEYVNRMIDDLC